MKKIIVWTLLMALLVTIVGPAIELREVFATETDSTKVLTLDLEASVTEAMPGTEFTVNVCVTENTGFRYGIIRVVFPEEALTVVGVDCTDGAFGDAVDTTLIHTDTSYINIPIGNLMDAMGMSESCYDATGVVGTITFRVNEGYADDIDVSVQVNEIRDLENLHNTFTINACTKTIPNPFCNHSYVDGVCEHCGEADPDAVVVLMGDANGDGVVNYLDAMLIAQYYVGDITDADLNLDAADVNGDDVVNYLDAMMVAQFYVGDIDSFPAEN